MAQDEEQTGPPDAATSRELADLRAALTHMLGLTQRSTAGNGITVLTLPPDEEILAAVQRLSDRVRLNP